MDKFYKWLNNNNPFISITKIDNKFSMSLLDIEIEDQIEIQRLLLGYMVDYLSEVQQDEKNITILYQKAKRAIQLEALT
jgi:hypothetical protein